MNIGAVQKKRAHTRTREVTSASAASESYGETSSWRVEAWETGGPFWALAQYGATITYPK